MAENNQGFIESVAVVMNALNDLPVKFECRYDEDVKAMDGSIVNRYLRVKIDMPDNGKISIVICSDGSLRIDIPDEVGEFITRIHEIAPELINIFNPKHTDTHRGIRRIENRALYKDIITVIYAAYKFYLVLQNIKAK